VSIRAGKDVLNESAIGDGPVDACFKAIDRALQTETSIESYQVRSVTAGREAQGEVLVRVRSGGDVFSGRGVSTDILEASVKAYLQALNEANTAQQSDNLAEAMV
jgi:2-isopropylmalate synthase